MMWHSIKRSKLSFQALTSQSGFCAASTISGGIGSPGKPELDRPGVDGEAKTPNVRRRVDRVLVRAHLGQIEGAPGLTVALQKGHDGALLILAPKPHEQSRGSL